MATNVHVSTHPCVRAKLSLLRSTSTNAKETKSLIHEIATIVACEALSTGLAVEQAGKVSSTTLLSQQRLTNRDRMAMTDCVRCVSVG